MNLEWVAINASLLFGMVTVLWVISVLKTKVSIIDPFWSIGFLIVMVNTSLRAGLTPGKTLLLVMVACWSLRLWSYLFMRSWSEPEDKRYAAFRDRFGPARYWWVSFFQVFLLQGALMMFISAPLFVAASAQAPDPISFFDVLGCVIFLIGFGFEVIGDWQLKRFKANPNNKGKICRVGLWGKTRHPNYFGDALLWWGFWISALDQPWGWLTIWGPLTMSFLLLKVSGVANLDAHMKRTRPGYQTYIDEVPAFFPKLFG